MVEIYPDALLRMGKKSPLGATFDFQRECIFHHQEETS
jgi:hypothetical protein